MFLRNLSVSVAISIAILVCVAKCQDFYTSVAGLENLLEAEFHLFDNFLLMTQIEKQHFAYQFLESTMEELRSYANDPDDYLGNPINTFKLIKRLVIDWPILEKINFDLHSRREYSQKFNDFPKPDNDDLHGAALGMSRIKNTYNLNVKDIAKGNLLGVNYGTEMTASDCFELGRSLYKTENYKESIEWLLEARTRLANKIASKGIEEKDDFPFLSDFEILEYLAPAAYFSGNVILARMVTIEILNADAKNVKAIENLKIYNRKLFKSGNTSPCGLVNEFSQRKTPEPTLYELYEKTCRGELRQSPSEQQQLRCRYVTKGVPFCTIAPFKLEELNLDPLVAIYHEAIYNGEIENILKATKNSVRRSTIVKDNSVTYTDGRTSKNHFLQFEENSFLDSLVQRIHDITGLDLKLYGEALQVANYGIGGHYGPHFDFVEDPVKTFGQIGNRIATAMFYISNVELGGATAFPFLKIAIPPVKGSLLFWYNLHESLEPDYRTKHAACPVVKGSKWICNEWFHERGQEFLRPCSLMKQGYKSEHLKHQ